jgi:hypothetical protein
MRAATPLSPGVYRADGVGTSGSVADKVYKTTELVRTSSDGIDDAIEGAITRASKTLPRARLVYGRGDSRSQSE